MSHWSAQLTRRNLLQTTAVGAAAAATGLISAPALLRAQGSPVKLGAVSYTHLTLPTILRV